MPSEGVLLIKSVTYDVARDGVNDFGQDTIYQASCCA